RLGQDRAQVGQAAVVGVDVGRDVLLAAGLREPVEERVELAPVGAPRDLEMRDLQRTARFSRDLEGLVRGLERAGALVAAVNDERFRSRCQSSAGRDELLAAR